MSDETQPSLFELHGKTEDGYEPYKITYAEIVAIYSDFLKEHYGRTMYLVHAVHVPSADSLIKEISKYIKSKEGK
jgi:hypothetical protein